MNKTPIGLIVTDLHLDSNIDTLSLMKRVVTKSQELGISTIYNLGDMFIYSKSQTAPILELFDELLDMLHQNNMKLVSLVGNHDKPTRSGLYSFLHPYRYHPSLEVVEESRLINVKSGSIALLSYFGRDKYAELLQNIKDRVRLDKCVLMTHVGVDGAINNDGNKVDGISPLEMSEFKAVYSGHYHNRSLYNNVVYVGSLSPRNFGEDDNKGYSILYDDLSLSQEVLEGVTRYKTIVFNLDSNTPLSLIIKRIKGYKTTNPLNKLRVVLNGETELCTSIDRNELLNAGADKVIKNCENYTKDSADHSELNTYNNGIIVSKFESFCKKEGLDYNYGLEILKESIYER